MTVNREETVIPKPSCIDAFCGAGGLSLGLFRAGFEIRAAFDWDDQSVKTYQQNIAPHVFQADAREVTEESLREFAGFQQGEEVDLLAGGPPCQGFSKQKREAHLGDPRNALVLEFLRFIGELRPRAFMLENVAQLAQVRGRHLAAEIEDATTGYSVTGHFYVAADYGVAQTRERVVMVGVRDDVEGAFRVPEATTPRWLTVGEALGDLPEPPADYSVHPEFPNHQAARVSTANTERFSYVSEGGGWQDIPYDLRLKCHQEADTSKGGWPDVYGRLRWDGQCPTITGGFDSFSRGRYGHPHRDRPLTPREAARLQGFPDEHVFLGTRHDVRHQIGNAVPPPLAEAIGRSILDALTRDPIPQNEEFEPSERQAALF